MNYIVFDLEWNQAPAGRCRPNPRIPFEILEIGAVKLNARRKVIGEFHETIKPLVYREMNKQTQKIVHLDMKELQKSKTFSPAARHFLEWCGEDYMFVTWGPSDIFELQRNLDYYKIRYDFPKPLLYYDLQKLYSLSLEDGKKRPALQEAVEALGIPQAKAFHGAYEDAWYTAEVMKKLNIKHPRIALQIEKNRAHGRALLEGVADYALERTDWRLELVDPEILQDVAGISASSISSAASPRSSK